jgi:sugar-specific transcriptional regulator TrmB
MSREVVLDQLQRLGMTGYEAKAYSALIAADVPISGYEVAKRSHVPRSTVYETLAKLMARGAVFEVTSNSTTAYIALPPESLISALRRDFERSTHLLKEALPTVVNPAQAHVVQHLTGRGPVMERARLMLDTVQRVAHIALWKEEAGELAPEIRAAQDRGVSAFVLTFGDPGGEGLEGVPHRLITNAESAPAVDRRLLLVAGDHREALIGSVAGERVSAMYSDDPAVALVVVEYIRHDIALQHLAGRIGLERIAEIWRGDEMLRRLAEQGELPGAGPTMDEPSEKENA